MAMALVSIEDMLFAKLKIATLPEAKVDPIAVTTIALNWIAPIPRDIGTISFMVFKTPGWYTLKILLYLNPELIKEGSCIKRCSAPPKTTPQASPVIPKIGTKNKIPIIMPTLYIIGDKAVAKNLPKTCKIPLIILLIPKIIGLKNIILISSIVFSFFSSEKPVAIRDTKKGAKIINNKQIVIKTVKNIFKTADTY